MQLDLLTFDFWDLLWCPNPPPHPSHCFLPPLTNYVLLYIARYYVKYSTCAWGRKSYMPSGTRGPELKPNWAKKSDTAEIWHLEILHKNLAFCSCVFQTNEKCWFFTYSTEWMTSLTGIRKWKWGGDFTCQCVWTLWASHLSTTLWGWNRGGQAHPNTRARRLFEMPFFHSQTTVCLSNKWLIDWPKL